MCTLVTKFVNRNLVNIKEQIHKDVLDLMEEREEQALKEIQLLKDKQAKNCSVFLAESQQKQSQLIRELQNECHELALLLIAQKTFNKLKENASMSTFNKKLGEITENSDQIKQQEIDNKLLSDQKQTILNQQKLALKRQLYKMDIEFASLRQKLEKELREKQNKEHELQQKMKNERNLNSAKRSNVEKLFQELEAKDVELRNLHMVTEKSNKLQSIYGNKIQKEITQLKRNLLQERNLKLDAFQKVDELQSHVYELEDNGFTGTNSRPHTSNSRAGHFNLTSSMSNLQNVFAKSSSPFPKLNSLHGSTLINRPKTTVGKYRINEIDEHVEDDSNQFFQETVLKLKESRLKSAKS
ncbi:coiled-coil domain-containing protein, partial [Brachionus plicatilis]